MKHLALTAVLFAVGAALTTIVVRLAGFDDVLAILLQFRQEIIIPIIVLTLLNVVVSVYRWQLVLRAQGEQITYRALLPIWLAGNAFSYLSPVVFLGGEGVRGYLLKKRLNLSWHKSMASVVLDQIVFSTSILFIAIVSGALLISFTGLPHITRVIAVALTLFGAIAAFLTLVYIQAFRNKHFLGPIMRFLGLDKTRLGLFLQRFEKELMAFLHIRSRTLWLAIGLSIVGQGIMVARNVAILYALGRGIQVIPATIVMGATYVGYTIPIPAALGTQELSHTALFSLAGLGAQFGIAFSFVFRAADLVVVVLGLLFLLRSLTALMAFGITRTLKINGDNGDGISLRDKGAQDILE